MTVHFDIYLRSDINYSDKMGSFVMCLLFILSSAGYICCTSSIIAHPVLPENYFHHSEDETLHLKKLNITTFDSSSLLVEKFRIYWNIPTQRCYDYFGVDVDVSNYGIFTNKEDGWAGENVTIFPHPGLYPEVRNGTDIRNGGIPQKPSLDAHVIALRKVIRERIPNQNFTGLAIIDYEKWQPLWSLNFDEREVYKRLSIKLVKEYHPEWPQEKLQAEAKKQFEAAARKFLEVTMNTARTMRPGGQWGFYHYPYCYNSKRLKPNETMECPQFGKDANDRMHWLFELEKVLYPSAYLMNGENATLNGEYVRGRLNEGIRVQNVMAHLGKTLPVYMYSRLRYKDTGLYYTKVDLDNSIKTAKDMGLDGVVLWDDHNLSSTQKECKGVKDYLDEVLGPYVENLQRK